MLLQRSPQTIAAAVLLLLVCAFPALAQKPRLDVTANINAEHLLYFEGTATARELTPEGQLQVRNELDILVEQIEDGGRFRDLPDRYIATSDESWKGDRLLEGERLEGRKSRITLISGQEILPGDEEEPFRISGTVDLSGSKKFRIIARLKHQWFGSFPAAECRYHVAGEYSVKPGIARKREGGGLLGDVGRFLDRAATEVGDTLWEGAGIGISLLGGGNSPLGIVQALLFHELQQQNGALGEAAQIIGGGYGGGVDLEEIFSGGSVETDDLTRVLVRGLVARYGRELGVPTLDSGMVDADALIEQAMQRIESELGVNLGLRNLEIRLDDTQAVVISEMPNLQGHGHLEPIIAYTLVNAALAAPWTEDVAAVFQRATGQTLGINVPTEAARMFARGQLATEAFLQLCRFTDAAGVATPGIVGTGDNPLEAIAAAVVGALLPRDTLPAGWMASSTHRINLDDLSRVIPGIDFDAQSISSGAIQVVWVDDRPVTVVGLETPGGTQAAGLLQLLVTGAGGEWNDGLLSLQTDPPLYAMQSGERTYLLQGAPGAAASVARNIIAGPGIAPRRSGLDALLPPSLAEPPTPPVTPEAEQPAEPVEAEAETPAPPATPDPPQEADPAPVEPPKPDKPQTAETTTGTPEPLDPPEDSYLRKAYLCTGLDGGRPVKLDGTLAAGSDRLGVYFEADGAPEDGMLSLRLYRDDLSLGRTLIPINRERRSVSWLMPDGGFTSGTWWVEIRVDGEPVARLLFEVE